MLRIDARFTSADKKEKPQQAWRQQGHSRKVPAAMKRALEKEAKAEGKSTGAYARGILADGLMAIA